MVAPIFNFTDVTAGADSAAPLDHKISGGINRLIRRAAMQTARQGGMVRNADGQRSLDPVASSQMLRRVCDGMNRQWIVDRAPRLLGQRYRSRDAAVALAHQLTAELPEALEEPIAPTRAMQLFRTRAITPIGAQWLRVRRFEERGDARWYGGAGTRIPTVSILQKDETFDVKIVVAAAQGNHFDRLAADFAGIDEDARKHRAAQRAILQFINQKLWWGDNDARYLGVKNYPFLPKIIADIALYRGTGASTNAQLNMLHSFVNWISENSKGAYHATRVVTSDRIRNYLATTRANTDGFTDRKILAEFVGAHRNISDVEDAWELKDIGGPGVDGMLFYNDDVDHLVHDMPSGIQRLPPQMHGFDEMTYYWAITGGLRMFNVGTNLLVLIPATASAAVSLELAA